MLPDYFLSLHLFSAHIYDDYDELRFFVIFLNFVFVCNANCNSRLVFFLLCSTPTTKRNIMGCVSNRCCLYQLYALFSDL